MAYSPLQLAEAFIQAGELADAVEALTQHLEANRGDDAARRMRAQVLARMGDDHLSAALDDLNRITKPTRDDLFWRSIIYERQGDPENARKILGDLYTANPLDERIAERYFYLLLNNRQYTDARTLLDTMPPTWDWLQKAGDLASEDEGEKQAIEYYTQALAHLETQFDTTVDAFACSIKSQILAARAQMYATLGQFAEADADYGKAEALAPDDAMLTFWHSLVAADLGDNERSLALCRLALDKASEGWRAQMMRTLKVMRDSGRYQALADAILADISG
jgi:tetratricopeptide (TPR) repeat protein